MINRRQFLTAAGLSMLEVKAHAAGRRCVIGYQPYCLPYMQANIIRQSNSIERFMPRDVTVEWSRALAGVVITNDMISKRTDLGLMGDSPAVLAVGKGAGIVIGATGYDTGEAGALVTRMSEVKHITDLEGARVGTPFGSFSHRQLLTMLKRHHVKVDLLNLDIRLQVSRLKNETIEAACTWEPYPSYIEYLGIGRRIMTGLDIERCSCMDYNPGATQHNLRVIGAVVVTKELLEKHRDIAVGFMAAVDYAGTLMLTRPDQAAKYAWADVKELPASVVRVGMDMYVPDIRLTKNVRDHLDGVGRMWAEAKLVASGFQFQYDTAMPGEAVKLAAAKGGGASAESAGFPFLRADQKRSHDWRAYEKLDFTR